MIKLEKESSYGLMETIRGMRNPLNSWNMSDTRQYEEGNENVEIGNKDLDLMKRLRSAGTDHRKYLRMITVYVDITAPLYWWKEFDTYKVGTVANSCSTMHKIQAKEFTLDDFSCEHLFDDRSLEWELTYDEDGCYTSKSLLEATINVLNHHRLMFLETKDKKYWWQMIQLLPSSYNQKRTVMLNYEVLNNIYKSRKNHKLDEWHTFCDWIETLPYAEELIIGEAMGKDKQ